MERILEFKNLEHSKNKISADLYLDGQYIVNLSVNGLEHLLASGKTNVGLYDYFRTAMLTSLNILDNCTHNLNKH
ncbi:MAG: hypothetical protein K2P99_03725 [Burkholderiales bacterium]|nr:hypothetical protein [Burkholderiales bacterium]